MNEPNYVTDLEVENGRLRAGMERIIEMGDYVYKPHEFAEVARAALAAQDAEQEPPPWQQVDDGVLAHIDRMKAQDAEQENA